VYDFNNNNNCPAFVNRELGC